MATYDITGIDSFSANTVVLNYVSIGTSTYSTTSANYFIGVDSITAGTSVSITLPKIDTLTAGQVLVFKDAAGGTTTHGINVVQHGGEFIDGGTSYAFSFDYESLAICWDGTNWLILTGKPLWSLGV